MIELSVAELRTKYYSKTNKQLAQELNISVPTLLELLQKHGIELKGKGYGSRANIIITREGEM